MMPTMLARWDLPKLAMAFVLTMTAGTLGSLATTPNIATWYVFLEKPPLTPPNWVFPAAWTFLYTLMAVSLWRVWRAPPSAGRGRALAWFAVQLAFNVAWSYAFFGARSPMAGLVVIVPFFLSIVICCVVTARVDRLAAWLYLPYLAWVAFAAYLNLGIERLN
jgi:tryptophan-rich sensory protein